MAVFIITILRNIIFLYEPTKNTNIAKNRFKKLNIVKKLSNKILFILLVGREVS